MARIVGFGLSILIALALPASGQSVVNYPGAGVMVAGELWDSFLPMNCGPSYSEATSDILRQIRIGNFDRAWSTPTHMWPGGWNFGAFWNKEIEITIWDPDPAFNPPTISAVTNPSYYASAGPNYAFAGTGNSNRGKSVIGSSDVTRNYKRETKWVDPQSRHQILYECGFPTTVGVDVKMRAHQYTLNWNNFNDFIIVELTLTNTGVVDMNADGMSEMVGHVIEGLAITAHGEYMSSYSLNTAAARANAFFAQRAIGYIGDNDPAGSPWAMHVAFPGESVNGLGDMGIFCGPQRYMADVWSAWTWLGATDTSGNPFPTLFGTDAVGTGVERGWYLSGGVGKGFTMGITDPRHTFVGSMGTFFVNGGRTLSSTQFDLAANPNLFQAGSTPGDLRTFMLKPTGRTAPNGDLKSTNSFGVNPYEASWTKGYTAVNNFDGNGFLGIGPFKLNVGQSVTVTWVEAGGYRLQGVANAIGTARWVYQNKVDANYTLPTSVDYPAVPEMRVDNTLNKAIRVRWDNRADSGPGFAGYKIYKTSQTRQVDWLSGGTREMDRYWESMTPGPTPEALKVPVNPQFAGQAFISGRTDLPNTWGPYELMAVIPAADLASVTDNSLDGYNYSWQDNDVEVGFQYWYYVAAYTNTGRDLGAGYVSFSNTATTPFVETSNVNRNGASGQWMGTYPFATLNSSFPKTPTGIKDIGAGLTRFPLLTEKKIDFGWVNLGASQILNVRVQNSADSALQIDFASSNASFAPTLSSIVVRPSEDSTISVQFTPNVLGSDSGFVVLTTNGWPSRDTISVYGTGGAGTHQTRVAWKRIPDSTQVIPSGAKIALDASENIYVADIDQWNPPSRTTITKYDSAGTFLWNRQDSIVGSLPTVVGLSVWGDQSLYIVTNGPTSTPTSNVYCLCRLNSMGTLLWRRTYAVPSGYTVPITSTVDKGGNCIVTGYAIRTPGNNPQIHTVKYDSNGVLQWTATYDGPISVAGDSADTPNAVTTDEAGNVFVAGTTSSSFDSRSNIVVLKYSPNGVQQWANIYNGPGNGMDIATDIALDFAGDVYVVGGSTGTTGGRNLAVLKLRGIDGVSLWTDLYDGPAHGDDGATACLMAQDNTLVVAGTVATPSNGSSAILLRYGLGGIRSQVLQYGGPSIEAFGGMLLEDQSGSLFFGGRCTGTFGFNESYAFKIDNLGTIQWEAHYSVNPLSNTMLVDMAPSGDGSLFLSGHFAATVGYRYFVTKLGEIPLPVEDEVPTLPLRAELQQNFPNPFNPSTVIRYAVPSRCHIDLTVYNLLGQRVAILQNGEQEAGFHEVKFDASGLSSGVYFYRLAAGSYVQTRKLLLVR